VSEFTASNGITVKTYLGDGFYVRDDLQANGAQAQALREFFQHERDVAEKPWLEAKPGEVWAIVPNGNAWVLESGAFMFDDESYLFVHEIREARRVWPVSA
jgi:hypothetical protein